MPRKPRTIVTDEMRSEVRRLRDSGMTVKGIADQVGISKASISCILENTQDGITLAEATEKHRKVMCEKHATEAPWLAHITPLHQHKQALENRIAERQAELDKAREEYRNFLATLEQLTKEA